MDMQPRAAVREPTRSDLPSPDRLRVRLLGAAELVADGVPLRRTRTRTESWLLALLILRANQTVERSWLAGLFWPESRQEQALYNLRRSLSNLRQVLGEEAYRLVSPTPHTIAFDLADAFCDVTAFDNALARKDTASLRRAVELYRGPLLPDCDADWVLPERSAREQAYLTALETLAAQAIQDGDAPEAVRLLRQVLHIEPFRETTHRALLEALASLGDKAELTLAYRQLRLRLHDELQSEPSAETRALYQELQARLQENASVPHRTASGSDSDLSSRLRIPWPVSELIGREEETNEVASLLATHRLVTLTGSGGIGKTRLALAVSTQVAPDFPDGVWFVDLSPVIDPSQVLPTVADVLEAGEEKGYRSLTDALRERLQGRRLLLVLDNAEHVLESCATLVDVLLEDLPKLRALVTSRQALGIAGEQVWRVPSLAFPDDPVPSASLLPADSLLEYAGLRLFVTRARAASSTFLLTEKNAPAIVRICARLDGIPLALELAAARVASLSAEQISARLEDAFRLLTSGARTALPRHQTLQALVDWSYDLLPEPEKVLLGRLSVFAGGWTLEAAEAVCGFAPVKESAVLDLLASLVDQSLVLTEQTDATMRYRMLETLRQYGAAKRDAGGETAAVRRRHRDYYLRLAEDINPKLRGSEQAYCLSILEAEHDNLRLALAFCLEDEEDGEVGLRLGAALHRFWTTRGHMSEGRERLTALLSHPGAQERTSARAHALNGAGVLVAMQGDYSAARSLFEESLSIFQQLGNRSGIAHCLDNLGDVAGELGDFAAAGSLYEESLSIFRQLGDKGGTAGSLLSQGSAAFEQGDYVTARSLYEESLTIFRELEDRNGIAYCLITLGIVAREQGDYAAARSLYEESLSIFQQLGNRSGIATAFNNLGNVARHQGDSVAARSLYEESLALRQELGDRNGVAATLNSLGHTALEQGDYPSADSLYAACLTIFREVGDRSGVADALNSQGNLAFAQGDYSSARSLYEEGLTIFQELGDKGSIAASFNDLGNVAFAQGDYSAARSLHQASLTLRRELGDKRAVAHSLEAFASLAAKEEQAERSIRLWGAADALRDALGTPLSPLRREKRESELADMRAALGEAAFAAAWEAGRAMRWEQAVTDALGEAA